LRERRVKEFAWWLAITKEVGAQALIVLGPFVGDGEDASLDICQVR
jgi:hypothetical protein